MINFTTLNNKQLKDILYPILNRLQENYSRTKTKKDMSQFLTRFEEELLNDLSSIKHDVLDWNNKVIYETIMCYICDENKL
jgi:hypothetical protein